VRRIVEEYKSGATVYELAERFGWNRETVSNQLKLSGVVMRNVVRGDEIARAIELSLNGHSADLIGKRLGRDPKTIRAVLAQNRDIPHY
jgi:DNA-binding CsgD family transcriptional regulator